MSKVQLGSSALHIERVVFGAWAIGGWFWGGSDDEQAIEAIHAALDVGLDAIDTAPMYGCGHSERVVGRAIAERRREVVLMTKVGLRWDDDRGAHFFDTVGPEGDPISVYGPTHAVNGVISQGGGQVLHAHPLYL